MIRAIIVEDEKMSSDELQIRLKKHFTEIEIIAAIDNLEEAIENVQVLDPDLIFLDIELLPGTGFNLLEETRGMKYHTIFTTYFNQYAAHAFKYSAVHFLQKPYDLTDLKQAISFYKERVHYKEETGEIGRTDEQGKEAEDAILHNLKASPENQIIGFPLFGGRQFVPVKDIIWCQAANVCSELHLTEGRRLTITLTLKKVERLVSNHSFFRIHKSYLININHMRAYMRGGGGEVKMSDGKELDVARSKKDEFIAELKRRGLM